MTDIRYAWRGTFDNAEVNALYAEAFGHEGFDDDWCRLVERHSLGWVTAHDAEGLVGFVNVPWDGVFHAWNQDAMVRSRGRRQGIGRRSIELAVVGAREAGCEWLPVDFDDDLRSFYLGSCGFTETSAGVARL